MTCPGLALAGAGFVLASGCLREGAVFEMTSSWWERERRRRVAGSGHERSPQSCLSRAAARAPAAPA